MRKFQTSNESLDEGDPQTYTLFEVEWVGRIPLYTPLASGLTREEADAYVQAHGEYDD